MSYKYGIVFTVGILLMSQDIWACHNFYAKDATLGNLFGHKPKYSFNLTTQPTESSTASTSTSTQCDWYTHFIHQEFEFIAEEAAQGNGPRLNILAEMMGCPTVLQKEFAVLLQNHYQLLFNSPEKSSGLHKNLQALVRRTSFQKTCHA